MHPVLTVFHEKDRKTIPAQSYLVKVEEGALAPYGPPMRLVRRGMGCDTVTFALNSDLIDALEEGIKRYRARQAAGSPPGGNRVASAVSEIVK